MNNKNIILVITASIASYKVLDLIRLLKGGGYSIDCILTGRGSNFITPVSISALSKGAVYTDSDFLNKDYEMLHISLAEKAASVVVVPATANILSKISNAIADDLATSFMLLLENKPVFLVPAMNPKMWRNKAFQRNISLLKDDGFIFIGPEEGDLACGDNGIGRMSKVDKIFSFIEKGA